MAVLANCDAYEHLAQLPSIILVSTEIRSLFSLLNVCKHRFGGSCADPICTDYSKLPANPPIDQIYLLDPLIATGGTACAALQMIVEWGIQSECSLLSGSVS